MIGKAKTCMIDDKASPGIYIEDVNGYLWTKEEWDNSVVANGVAVVTEDQAVVLENYISVSELFGDATAVDGVLNTVNLEEAILDYDGHGNTEAYIASLSSGNLGVISTLRSSTFADGTVRDMPAYGQLKMIMDNLYEISDIFTNYLN